MKDRRTQDDWIKLYQQYNAYWVHNGDPTRPHAELSGGEHSDGFANSELVFQWAHLLDQAADQLVDVLMEKDFDISSIQAVVGPAYGAIKLADNIARHINWRTGVSVRGIWVEKDSAGAGKKMVLTRYSIKPGEVVLVCEDVYTSRGSAEATMNAIVEAGGVIAPFTVGFVNRSDDDKVLDSQMVTLIRKQMNKWPVGKCPLCDVGSKALRPKGLENWRLLNGIE